jgi:hypothetical protein
MKALSGDQRVCSSPVQTLPHPLLSDHRRLTRPKLTRRQRLDCIGGRARAFARNARSLQTSDFHPALAAMTREEYCLKVNSAVEKESEWTFWQIKHQQKAVMLTIAFCASLDLPERCPISDIMSEICERCLEAKAEPRGHVVLQGMNGVTRIIGRIVLCRPCCLPMELKVRVQRMIKQCFCFSSHIRHLH